MDLDGWDNAKRANGEDFIVREMSKSKASLDAIADAELAMKRIASGTTIPGETGSVEGGISELRVDIDSRWYRLLYGRKNGKYVGLVWVAKKQNKLDRNWIDLAKRRLKEHT